MATVINRTGDVVQLPDGPPGLGTAFDGRLIAPGDDAYSHARSLWNGMIDREPGLIACCRTVDDVGRVVRLAADHDLRLAVRGGGHNVAGTASVDGGLVVDLTEMKQVTVDREQRRVSVGGGATWADVDTATQTYGLATPGGVVSETGVGGLTLGGGIGWLRRKHGLSCDNLVGAQLVTADGEVIEVAGDTHAELLWALRGGGGGLGVVTRFDLDLHPVGPDVYVAFVLYHGERATEVLHAYRDYTADLADEVSSFVILGTVPEEDDFPEDAWGEPYAMLMACSATSDLADGERLVGPLRDLGDPIVDMSGPMPYDELQQLLDADYPEGLRYYWKSLHLPALSDDIVELATAWSANRPSNLSTVDIWHLGGAMARVPASATAFGDRSAPYLLGVEANWADRSRDAANLAWTRGCIDAFRAHSTGREYLNFPGFFEGGDDARRAAHGDANYDRLRHIRQRLDPTGLFRP